MPSPGLLPQLPSCRAAPRLLPDDFPRLPLLLPVSIVASVSETTLLPPLSNVAVKSGSTGSYVVTTVVRVRVRLPAARAGWFVTDLTWRAPEEEGTLTALFGRWARGGCGWARGGCGRLSRPPTPGAKSSRTAGLSSWPLVVLLDSAPDSSKHTRWRSVERAGTTTKRELAERGAVSLKHHQTTHRGRRILRSPARFYPAQGC